MSCPGPKQWFFLRAGHFYALFIPRNLFSQPLHNPFFQPRDIRLGNPEKIRDFFLRFLPSLRHIDAEPELHNHLLPLRELADCASQHAMFRLLLEPLIDHILLRSEDIRQKKLISIPVYI